MFGAGDGLAVRLALLLSVALLPLGLVALFGTIESRRTDLQSAERTLVILTAEAEAGRRTVIESALATASMLGAAALNRLSDPEACSQLMADTLRQSRIYSFAGFTEPDGIMRCGAPRAPHDFSQEPVFRMLREDPRPLINRRDAGAVTGRQVLIATQPIFDDEDFRGFQSVSISAESLALLTVPPADPQTVRTVLFNRLGNILSATGIDEPERLLPAGKRPHDLTDPAATRVFRGRTEAGEDAVFAVAELIRGQLFVLGVWSPDAGPAAALRTGIWPGLLPLAMWLASVGVVFVGLNAMVIRQLRRLRTQMHRFALGDRSLPSPASPRAPREIREVHAAFVRMAAQVARDEADLSAALVRQEEALRERTMLLKEVHHRVKNNLQLIASILNLQMRRLRDPHTRRVLQNVQDRVIGLASIHRSLYQSDQLSQLRADTLIEELLRHLFAVGTDAGAGTDLRTDIAPLVLQADQLVPLSLLVTEVVTNALKYGGPAAPGERPWIAVRLGEADGTVELCVVNSLGPEASKPGEDDAGTSLGRELIAAFALQLGADLEQGRRERPRGACWQVRLTFPLGSDQPAAGPDAAPPVPRATASGRQAGAVPPR